MTQVATSRPLESCPDLWIPATVAADLLGITPRGVGKRVLAQRWQHRYLGGEKGGRRLEIALAALPEAVQVRYLQRAEGRGQKAADGEPEPKAGGEYEQASPKDRAEADRRLTLLNAWWAFSQAAEGRRQKAAKTSEFVRIQREAGQRVSKAALYAWAAARRARGLDGLVPAYRGGRNTSLADDDKVLFLSLWGSEARPSTAAIHRAYLVLRDREGLTGPAATLGAMRYMLAGLSEEEKAALRMGKKAYREMVLPYIERDYESLLPNDWWVMDHHQLDFIARGPRGKRCRPWITVVMDLRTRRAIVVVSVQPNQDVILYALGKAMLAWGIPRNLYLDNGKDFRAKSVAGGRGKKFRLNLNEPRVRSLCDQLGVLAHFADPYNAQAKPVERFIGTLAGDVAKLFDSYVGRSTAEKPEGLADTLETAQLPEISEVERVVTGWVESDYHVRPHHGHGMNGRSPDEVWGALIGQAARRSVTREQLRYFRMRSERVEIGRSMVKVFGEPFAPASENPDCLYGWQGKQAYALYDPQDVGQVFLVDLEDSPIGWLIAKRRLGWGTIAKADIAESKKLEARGRALRRAARDELMASRTEPNALRRILREKYAAAAPAEGAGGSGPQVPPTGGGKVIEMVPISPGARASARAIAQTPTEDARLHVARARIADEEPPPIRREARAAKPSRADLSDEAIEMLGRRRATGE